MQILTISQDRLNKVSPGFGDALIKHKLHEKYLLMFKDNIQPIFSTLTPHDQQVFNIFLQFLNIHQYSVCQVIVNLAPETLEGTFKEN